MFATKEACRGMANPTVGDLRKLKRAAKYLVGRVGAVWKFEWQDEGQRIKVYTDSDWAGCLKTRKSSSGGLVKLGEHCLKAWCSTQGALALSSAEAEYYAMVEGVLRARGLQSIGREIGMDGAERSVGLELLTDSSAAKSFVSTRGAGKMRHIEVRWFWLQEEVRAGRVCVTKVKGEWNPADLMTKYLTVREIEERLEWMGVRFDGADEKVMAQVRAEARRSWHRQNRQKDQTDAPATPATPVAAARACRLTPRGRGRNSASTAPQKYLTN